MELAPEIPRPLAAGSFIQRGFDAGNTEKIVIEKLLCDLGVLCGKKGFPALLSYDNSEWEKVHLA